MPEQVVKLIPEKRYLIYCSVQLDKNYFLAQWYAASYHTNEGRKAWFLIEHPSEFLRQNHEANFVDPITPISIKNMPRAPK